MDTKTERIIFKELSRFLEECITPWHTAAFIKKQLPANVHVEHHGATILALLPPRGNATSLLIAAAHTDSPGLKLKPQFAQNGVWGVDVYGEPLLSSWLNRDLYPAGRLVTENEGQFVEELIAKPECTTIIPQLALHLDRDVNDKGLLLNRQTDLPALKGASFVEGALSHDIMLVPKEPPAQVAEGLIAASRLDNLLSCFALLNAFLEAKPQANTGLAALFFNHEEVGSLSSEGASSYRLHQFLHKYPKKGLIASLDVVHALHPNQPQKSEPCHAPLLKGGTAIKYSANMRYATTATSAAYAKAIAGGLPLQEFVSRSDIKSGSTIGPSLGASLGMETVDLGTPLLSMHSIREIAALSDVQNLLCWLKNFYAFHTDRLCH